jgi:aerobic-type carbon monoxide dehydrogenase small subunit (CoxS/CutS family)
MSLIKMTVNGAPREVDVEDPTTPLLYILRNDFGDNLGSKFVFRFRACPAQNLSQSFLVCQLAFEFGNFVSG